jgi:hypothetical protein
MLSLIPVLIMLLTASILVTLHFVQPTFKYPWMIAVGGSILALIVVYLWRIRIPQIISISSWQPATVFSSSPTWSVDGISWPYSLALTALVTAVIWTSIVRSENDPIIWAGTLILGAMGILALTAENPLTLILAWSAIDLAELVSMLRSTIGEEQNQAVIIAFTSRVVGTGLVIWACLIATASGTMLNFQSITTKSGIFLLIATGLRLGILPLHLPYQPENTLRRGFGTTLRLVSAAASLSLLARIPAGAILSSLSPVLIVLAAIAALYASWLWLRASDEIQGRPFWILGMASLSIAASLRGNPVGSIGWGVTLVLSGGLLFLFSARQRQVLWLPLLALFSFSTLPFSLTSSAWQTGNQSSWLFIVPFLPAQALLMAGFVRHALHPGETSLESHARWTKVLYPIGLFLLPGTAILLGLWGWSGANTTGILWASLTDLFLAAGFSALAFMFLPRLALPNLSTQWIHIFRLEWLFRILSALFRFFHEIADIITSSLEGEGGLLWSLLLLALILSILSTWGR